jgi:AcrR family transcriptional regulator
VATSRAPRRRSRKAAPAAAEASTPADGLRARKKRQVRDAILAVCGRLFRTRGFDETTIDDIVGAVEISRQTFFNYFPGKDAVLAELGLAWLGAQGERARVGARSDRPARFMAGFRRVLREQLAAVEQDREFMRLVFTRSGLFFPHGPQVGSRADEPRLDRTRAFFAGLASLIRAAQEAGELRRDVPADQIAEMVVAVLVVTIRFWLTGYWGGSESLVERGMRAFDVLEDGLRARTEPP